MELLKEILSIFDSVIDSLKVLWGLIFKLKPYGINVFAIFSVNIIMEIVKRSPLKKIFKTELMLWMFFISLSFLFSSVFSLVFILPKYSFLFFVKTVIITFVLSWGLYELVKSIKPLQILKEIIKDKMKK